VYAAIVTRGRRGVSHTRLEERSCLRVNGTLFRKYEIALCTKRRTAMRKLMVMVMLALMLATASPALAGGATQISGVAFFDDPDPEVAACKDTERLGATYALIMTEETTEGLDGCLYTFVDEDVRKSPSGTYLETGRELFVASDGSSTFETTYRFEAKYEDVDNLIGEIFGRCQHPIVEGSGTGIYEGVSGILLFKDDVETGEFLYRGHLRY
jgi:hypothetical protein